MAAPSALELSSAFADAERRWPGIAAERDPIVASITAVAPTVDALRARGDELILAHAAAAGDRLALAGFEREIMPRGHAAIRRYLGDADRTAEITQQLRIHLLIGEPGPPRLARFDARAPLTAWIAMCGARLALHALRAARGHDDLAVAWSDALGELIAVDPVVESLRERWGAEIGVALRDACAALPPRLRAVVRLTFLDSASVDDIAAVYQVHRVTVWRWLQEAQETLRASVRHHLRAPIANDSLTFTAMVAWVDDHVILSLDQALTPTATDARS